MRMLVMMVLGVATSAMAGAIGGTVTASYANSDMRTPKVQIDVGLTCSLTCDPSAPTKHYQIVAGLQSYYASAPTETGDLFVFYSTDLDLDGQASDLNSNFKPGQTVFLKATSVTCHCGNRTGEGGYIDLTTPNIVIPALISTETSVRVGDDAFFTAQADLRGAEQVEMKAVGGGLNTSKLFGVADLTQQGYAIYHVTFTEPGTATVTATLQPSGVVSTETWTVVARNSSTGGGGGSSATGGGSGGGGSSSPEGCSTTGGLSVLALLALALRRR